MSLRHRNPKVTGNSRDSHVSNRGINLHEGRKDKWLPIPVLFLKWLNICHNGLFQASLRYR